MSVTIKSASAVGLLFALGACGGSSSPDDVSRVSDEIYFGTTSNVASANGLPFAAVDSEPIEDIAEATVLYARFVSDNLTGATTLVFSEETITVSDFGDDGVTGTLTIDGELVTFTDGTATLADGNSAFIFFNAEGDWSNVISAYSYEYSDGDADGLNFEGSFAAGLETNPDNLPTTMGTTTYFGGLNGYSTLLDLEGNVTQNESSFDGDVEIEVQFADGTVGGSMIVNGPTTFELALSEADILGNGFGTTANVVVGCVAIECTSATLIGGTFFGPSGEELTGVTGIDYTQVDDEMGGGYQMIGAGGFIAIQGAP